MRTVLLVAVVVLAGSGGDIMVARAMKKVARGERWKWKIAPRRIGRALTEGGLWIGIGLMALSFLAFITVLSWANVSFIVPATAANHIVGALAAKWILKERISKLRWAGVGLVTAGVLLVFLAQ